MAQRRSENRSTKGSGRPARRGSKLADTPNDDAQVSDATQLVKHHEKPAVHRDARNSVDAKKTQLPQDADPKSSNSTRHSTDQSYDEDERGLPTSGGCDDDS